MSLDQALHLVSYACLGLFVLAVVVRWVKIASLPMHLRWELYPVAHEKGRAHYGGSYFEEVDWWTKKRESSMLGELKVMIPEIVLLAGVREKNKTHWARTFPFHFGLYLLVGATVLMIAVGLAAAFGAAALPGTGQAVGGFWQFLGTVTMVAGYAGFGLGLIGSLALLGRRFLNSKYREYTTGSDYFNLLFFVVAFGLALIAQLAADPDFTRMRAFFAGLVSFGSFEPAANAGLTPLLGVEVALLSLLVFYIPLTHMSHFFTKFFMYHDIRWSDEPNVRGGKIEAKVKESLQFKPTWSAPHIQGDGKKTWVDIATSPGFDEAEAEKTQS